MKYNVGIGTGYSVREVIRTAEAVTGKSIAVKEGPRRAGDPPALVASSEKIRAELGWLPRYTELRPIVETAWNGTRPTRTGTGSDAAASAYWSGAGLSSAAQLCCAKLLELARCRVRSRPPVHTRRR